MSSYKKGGYVPSYQEVHADNKDNDIDPFTTAIVDDLLQVICTCLEKQ
jgi:hypothetical protein